MPTEKGAKPGAARPLAYFRGAELARLLRRSNPELQDLIHVGFYTGMRPDEMFSIAVPERGPGARLFRPFTSANPASVGHACAYQKPSTSTERLAVQVNRAAARAAGQQPVRHLV